MDKKPVPGDSELNSAAARLADLLSARGLVLATAESCTAGWIAKCCTDLAGSSAWFERGFVTYSNEAKQQMLAVDPAVLESEGPVSEEVARQMAIYIADVLHQQISAFHRRATGDHRRYLAEILDGVTQGVLEMHYFRAVAFGRHNVSCQLGREAMDMWA